MPIVEWIENVELVCEFCAMDRVEHVLLLCLQGCALAVYRQLNKEQRADQEEIKKTAYVTDAFGQFTAWQLQQNKTIDEFLADSHRLIWLVGEPLPERWLPQHVRQLLWVSSRRETIALAQLLIQARTIVIDDWEQEQPIVTAMWASRSNIKASPKSGSHTRIVRYNCNS